MRKSITRNVEACLERKNETDALVHHKYGSGNSTHGDLLRRQKSIEKRERDSIQNPKDMRRFTSFSPTKKDRLKEDYNAFAVERGIIKAKDNSQVNRSKGISYLQKMKTLHEVGSTQNNEEPEEKCISPSRRSRMNNTRM